MPGQGPTRFAQSYPTASLTAAAQPQMTQSAAIPIGSSQPNVQSNWTTVANPGSNTLLLQKENVVDNNALTISRDRGSSKTPDNNDPSGGGPPSDNGWAGREMNRNPDGPPPSQSNPPGGGNGGGGGGNGGGGDPPNGNGNGNKDKLVRFNKDIFVNVNETHFDTKLKPDSLPCWDGDPESLWEWITELNDLADRSESLFKALGEIAPTRFTEAARQWWYALPEYHRRAVTKNWDTFKVEVQSYWWNATYVEEAQTRAINVRYRQRGYENETPTQYYIRKVKLLSMVYQFSPQQVMAEILRKAPTIWGTVLNPRMYNSLSEFQSAMKFNERLLTELGESSERRYYSNRKFPRIKAYNAEVNRTESKPKFNRRNKTRRPIIGMQGRSPKFPRDDSNVSKGRKPEEYPGTRGCIHCGSMKHWDRECKHASRNQSQVRTLMAGITEEDQSAEELYLSVYQAAVGESDSNPEPRSDDQDSDHLSSEDQPNSDNGVPDF